MKSISPYVVTLSLSTLLLVAPAQAQLADNSEVDGNEIIVTASRPRGSVVTDIPPVQELNAEEIASYGASSVSDLVAALSTSTTSGRGRGGGRPIVLINGQRTSGFREIRDLPPEAIQTVQVFPEELALQYGYRPDQRVINFVLKNGYFGVSGEVKYGVPTVGGQSQTELESTITRIGENSRFNLNVEYQNKTAITENERDIIQDAAGTAVNLGDFRTLVAPNENLELNGVYSRSIGPGTTLSLNAGYVYGKSRGLLGLPNGTLDVAGDDVFRYFTQYGPLRRNVQTDTFQGGAAVNGTIDKWRWSLTGDYTRALTNTRTDRSGNIAPLQAAIDAGTTDPFASDFGSLLPLPTTDESRSLSQTLNSLATVSGTLLVLPSGPVTTTFSGGYSRQDLSNRDIRRGITTSNKLGRDNFSTRMNVEVPLADENTDVAEAIGKLSVNGNIGYSDLSDFGGLMEFGFGLNWEPFDGFVVTASAIGEEAAPSIQQLGNPVIITPDVTTFDFNNGQTVLAAITTGGNPALLTEKRRDIKLAVNYRPQWLDGMTFLTEYFRNNSKNVASSFPLLTPEIEAAFPDRVTRGPDGFLTAIDTRPVNFSEVRSEKIRYGLNFSKSFGQTETRGEGRRANGGATPSETAPSENVAKPEQQNRNDESAPPSSETRPNGRGPGGGRPGGFGGRPSGGRWSAELYHTIQLNNKILIRPGVQELDLLNGSATGSSGGSPRHMFELSGGLFNKGLGFRVEGKHQTATSVNGGLTSSDLRFSDLTTLSLRAFINLDDRGDLTNKVKFLKGSRIAFRIDNIFNDIQTVRDDSGVIPLRYQAGYLDPVGRYVEVSFRKRF